MAIIHFLNVLEGDCNIIQHDSGRITVIDVSCASNSEETPAERAVRASAKRQEMLMRTQVPKDKIDYRQKLQPDNPILYLQDRLGVDSIFRFILTHPDMDHLDGIRDLFQSFPVHNVWDTDNKKELGQVGGGYNQEDWDFYLTIRDDKASKRRIFFSGNENDFYQQDQIKILAPTPALVERANESGDYNDASYVLLFTPPRAGGKVWKLLFAGDSHDDTWEHILDTHSELIEDVDILFAPHHGRDSDRGYEFLNVLKPKITLFGNASSEHLAYDKYPEIRITNNQAGYVILDVSSDSLRVLVKNKEFADNFRNNPKRKWGNAPYDQVLHAYEIGRIQ